VQNVSGCFATGLDHQMGKIFSQLDDHHHYINHHVAKLQTQLATGNAAIIDAHRTTSGHFDSLVASNTAFQPKLELLDRVAHIPTAEETTALCDNLAHQIHEGQNADAWMYGVSRILMTAS